MLMFGFIVLFLCAFLWVTVGELKSGLDRFIGRMILVVALIATAFAVPEWFIGYYSIGVILVVIHR